MMKWKCLLWGAIIGSLVFLAAGCRTSYWEWSGSMANQSGSHVQPFNPGDSAQQNDAVRPYAFLPLERRMVSGSGSGIAPQNPR